MWPPTYELNASSLLRYMYLAIGIGHILNKDREIYTDEKVNTLVH